MRLSRATRPPEGDAASAGFLHRTKALMLALTKPPRAGKRGQGITPTVDKNGWSVRKLLENCWSLFVLMLKDEPMSAKAARLTMSLMIGIRYSKLPSNCVSPPTEVNERCKDAMLLPL